MKKLLAAGLMTVVTATSVATTTYATAPEVPSIQIGIHYSEASATAIPKEEAKQIGLDALAQFFGADFAQLGNYHIEIGYNPAIDPRQIPTTIYQFDGVDGRIPVDMGAHTFEWPLNIYRSTWDGTISVPNDRTPTPDGLMLRSSDLFRFRVDAQTGELVGLQFFPSELPTPHAQKSECMGSPAQVFEYLNNMTDRHNNEYANFAMQFVENANIFEGETLRAAVTFGGWMMGRNGSVELNVTVAVESATGETVSLTFQGRERKELVELDFFSRMIDHAVDSNGNIVEPASQFVGNPEITNWIYR